MGNINISLTNFDNLLWCATRYCIGRHSYVSSYAQDFWKIISGNRDKLNNSRLLFLARDIRSEISNYINCYNNVIIKNAHNDRIRFDAFTLLCEYKRMRPDQKWDGYLSYEVDCIMGEVEAYPLDASHYKPGMLTLDLDNELDLPYWAMLANCIDRQYEVTVSDNGEHKKYTCIKHPVTDEYVNVDNWSSFINNDYIICKKLIKTPK